VGMEDRVTIIPQVVITNSTILGSSSATMMCRPLEAVGDHGLIGGLTHSRLCAPGVYLYRGRPEECHTLNPADRA
jgi:hypothetical protein